MTQEVLHVEARQKTGSHHAKHMRRAGKIPAILYGHGEASVSLSLNKSEIQVALRHNAHLVQLKGASNATALLKEIQWDPFGNEVLHVDLTRVDAHEVVEVELPIQLRGMAPGLKQGGVVDHQMHSIKIECPATSIPENLELTINSLQLGESLLARDLQLPPKAKLMVDEELVVVACVEPVEESEEIAVVDGAEPEVIGAKKDEESADG